MSLRQVMQPRSAVNGYGRRRVEREVGIMPESKFQPGKSVTHRFTNTGKLASGKVRDHGSSSRDRLVYLAACLIGHDVEVHVKDGSVYSGIFHATNADKDFGVVLKMARLVKDGSPRGEKPISESVSMAPSKMLIIPSKELVQVMAKDVSITMDDLANELEQGKQHEIMLDSVISQSRHLEMERELERWVPDKDAPHCPELENTFDDPWNRNWDQFETNEALFGVKSTFDEELYTTKLERGPQMRELEREALRIAREIEGEDTLDSHVAEERGIQSHRDFDIDEETRYSSVLRRVDSDYEENEDTNVDSQNSETFGGSSNSVNDRPLADLESHPSSTGAQVLYGSLPVDEAPASQLSSSRNPYCSDSNYHARQVASELVSKSFPALDVESRMEDNEFTGQCYLKHTVERQNSSKDDQSAVEDSITSLDVKKDLSDNGMLSPNAAAYAPPSCVPSKSEEKVCSPAEPAEGETTGKVHVAPPENSRVRPGSSASSTSGRIGAFSASSGPCLSPSSSVGSLSSEKSTLNPHAKEFKLNPNAKSFRPTPTTLRPTSPAADGSFYFPANVPTTPPMHGTPLGFGMGPSYGGHPPVLFNPPGAAPMQAPQAFYHPNGHQYGQQMIVGHPRAVMYMPSYLPEMPYKGRDF